jgi:hydroxypyruvate isomerase
MYQLSANIELMFPEVGIDPIARIKAAADAGFTAVEMWFSTDKDVEALRAVLDDTGVTLTSMVAGPRMNVMWPGVDPRPFHEGIHTAVEHAQVLECPRVFVDPGAGFLGLRRAPQLERLAEILAPAVERVGGSHVSLMLEAVNARVDHPGALLDRTTDAVTVARAIGDDSLGVAYDLYHSLVEGENPANELANASGLVTYVQLAQVPGRGEPVPGVVDWAAQLAVVRASGYDGPIGLEIAPSTETRSAVAYIRELAERA